MSGERCTRPLDAAALSDYWIGEMPRAEQRQIELHLLECDECGDRLREIIALAEGTRQLAREGALRVVLDQTFLDRAAQEGLRIRQYAPPPDGGVQCTVTQNDDLVVARLRLGTGIDLTNVESVDLAMCDPDGHEMMRLRAVPFHAASKEIIFNEPIARLRTLTTEVLLVKMFAVDPRGERLLGEYTFNHYAS